MFSLMMSLLLIDPYHGAIPKEEATAVSEIIVVMSESNLLSLAGKRKYLLKVGKKIEHLHPLDFLKVVAISKPLLDHLKNIQKSSVKWRAFVSGISKGFEEVSNKEKFGEEITVFANGLKFSKDDLLKITAKKDWDSFVRFVLTNAKISEEIEKPLSVQEKQILEQMQELKKKD
jgi:hypothetical protein